MIRKINPLYDNEMIKGRVSSVKELPKGGLSICVRENYKDRREGIEPKYIYVAAFEDVPENAQRLKKLHDKLDKGLIGVVLTMSVRTDENEKGISRKINWFDCDLPARKPQV